MKAIFLAAFVVIAVISIYTQITSHTKRDKTQDLTLWKKYNLRMHITNVITSLAGISIGALAANIFQYGW